jgi:hypothetical protein
MIKQFLEAIQRKYKETQKVDLELPIRESKNKRLYKIGFETHLSTQLQLIL